METQDPGNTQMGQMQPGHDEMSRLEAEKKRREDAHKLVLNELDDNQSTEFHTKRAVLRAEFDGEILRSKVANLTNTLVAEKKRRKREAEECLRDDMAELDARIAEHKKKEAAALQNTPPEPNSSKRTLSQPIVRKGVGEISVTPG